jgi:uncharacterized repeat protein (TIGR02543 family)
MFDFGEELTSSIILYARWAANAYTVVYNANGGTGEMENTNLVYNEQKNLNINTFTRTGYTFAGWARTPDGTREFTDGQNVSNLTIGAEDTITLYAVWTGNPYTVYFNANGGSGTMASSDFIYGTPKDLPQNTFTHATLGFAGWATSPTGTAKYWDEQSVSDLTAEPTITLYALWDTMYTVEYHANGGDGSMADSHFVYTVPQNLRTNTFTNSGYTFVGWATSRDGDVVYTNGQSVHNLTRMADETITLYAVWAHLYTVAYNANGGNGSMENTIFTYGIAQRLRMNTNTITRTGYTFTGWATSAGGTVEYSNGQEVIDLTSMPGETVTLYAVWVGIPYTVAYNANGGSGQPSTSNFVYGTPQKLRANTFTRNGFVFAGWATTSGQGQTVQYMDEQTVSDVSSTGGTVTLYAVWTQNFYTVLYDANGGSGTAMTNSDFVRDQAYNLRINTYARVGYTFDGWATSPSGPMAHPDGGLVSNLATARTEIKLYAVWKGIPYTVQYNNNGGTGTMSPTDFVYGTAQTLRSNTFTKTDYAFAGWASSPSATTPTYLDGASVNSLSSNGTSVTLYAVWTNQLTVIYNANNGSGSSMANSTFTFGVSQGLRANTYSRTGYTFGGWATSPTGSAVHTNEASVSFPSTVGITVTLYAYWVPITYKVEYNANNGTGTMDPTDFTYGTPQTLRPNAFTRTGYIFSGWAETSGGTVAFSDEHSVNNLVTTQGAIKTLYAVWTLFYTVTYDANGGNGTPMESTKFIYNEAQNLRANSYTRTGYKFLGWSLSQTATTATYTDGQRVTSNLTTTPGYTVTLYAVWAHIYTVTYNNNGGAGTMSPTEFTYGTAQTLRPNTFTRTGYTFDGWAETSNGDRVYQDRQSVNNLTETVGGTVPLFAKWLANTYTVAYNANGGTGTTMTSTPFTYDQSQGLRTNTYSRTGYTFAGWSITTNGTVQYGNGESVSNLTSTQGATVTLYAVWTPITYRVEYDGNGGEGWMGSAEFTYDVAQNLSENSYTRANYSFRGWALTDNATTAVYQDKHSVSNLSNTQGYTVKLYAVWAYTFTVIYVGNGNTGGGMLNSPFIYGVAQNLLNNGFTRTGYTFSGWATSPGGSVVYTNGQSVNNLTSTPGGEVNLYAVWR